MKAGFRNAQWRYVFEMIRAGGRQAFQFAESYRVAMIAGLITYCLSWFSLPLNSEWIYEYPSKKFHFSSCILLFLFFFFFNSASQGYFLSFTVKWNLSNVATTDSLYKFHPRFKTARWLHKRELWVSDIQTKLTPGLGLKIQIKGNRRQGLVEGEETQICKHRLECSL